MSADFEENDEAPEKVPKADPEEDRGLVKIGIIILLAALVVVWMRWGNPFKDALPGAKPKENPVYKTAEEVKAGYLLFEEKKVAIPLDGCTFHDEGKTLFLTLPVREGVFRNGEAVTFRNPNNKGFDVNNFVLTNFNKTLSNKGVIWSKTQPQGYRLLW